MGDKNQNIRKSTTLSLHKTHDKYLLLFIIYYYILYLLFVIYYHILSYIYYLLFIIYLNFIKKNIKSVLKELFQVTLLYLIILFMDKYRVLQWVP